MSWEYRFSLGRMYFDPELRIMFVRYDASVVVTLASAKEQIAAMRRHSEGKLHPLLVDLSKVKHTEGDARRYLGSDEAVSWKALALLGGSPIGNMLGNVYLALASKKAPAKLFTDEPAALAWLKQYVG